MTPTETPDTEAPLAVLERVGAIITDSHIVYTSGRHGSSYVNKDALYPHTAETSALCAIIARTFADDGVDVVAGPTIGGVIMAQWVAHHLCELTGRKVLAVYAEEEGKGDARMRIFRRGYGDLLSKRRVLVVEDVMTTGGSVHNVVDAVRQHSGVVIGVGALCNRGGVTAALLDIPKLFAVAEVLMESWDEDECPLCRLSAPINTRVGKGAAFLARQRRIDETKQ